MKLTTKIELVVKMFIENRNSLSKLYIRAEGRMIEGFETGLFT